MTNRSAPPPCRLATLAVAAALAASPPPSVLGAQSGAPAADSLGPRSRAGGATAERLAGAWLGALGLEVPVRVLLRFQRADSGAGPGRGAEVAVTADFPDQGARGLPMASRLAGDSVHLQLVRAGIAFDGRLTVRGDSLVGTFAQGPQRFALALTRLGAADEAGLARPQEPRRPYPYRDRQVQVPGGAPGVTLAGTLTLPADSTRAHPGVLLVAGSGPLDRNATVAGHRTFLVLADQLTRAGFAVLRLDKRGVGRSTGDFASVTTEDLAADARAAVAFLRAQPGVDARRTGVLGHSEGALVAARVAGDTGGGRVAFTVLLAPPGLPGDRLMIERAALLLRARGVAPATVAKDGALRRALFDALLAPGDTAATRRRVHAAVRAALARMSDDERRALGYDAASWETGAEVFLDQRAWFRRWLRDDPRPAYRAMRGPVLAVFGSLDQQVPAALNHAPVRRALGGRDAVAILPGVNHLMQPAASGGPAEYGRIPETVAESVLALLRGWLRRTAGLE